MTSPTNLNTPKPCDTSPPQRPAIALAEQIARARQGSEAVKAGRFYTLDDIPDDEEDGCDDAR